MTRTVLSGIAITAAMCGTAFAQTSVTSSSTPGQNTSAAAQSITMSGCVASASGGSQGFTLSNPIVLPSTGSASASAAGAPSSSATAGGSTASGATTQPPSSALPPSSAGTSATAGTSGTSASHPTTGAATSGTAGTAGTSGTAGTAGTAGTSGTAATGGTSATGAAGTSAIGGSTSGSVTGAAGAAPSSSFNGYRLSGSDLSQWAGKRVEVTGTFAPSSSANTTASATGAQATTMQEFRVVSVKPVGGSCPQE